MTEHTATTLGGNHPEQAGIAASACLCDALLHDCGCAIAVVDPAGVVTACNDAFSALQSGGKPAVPPDLETCLSEAAAAAHARARRAVIEGDRPVVIDGPFAGQRSISTYRPYSTPDGDRLLLVVARWAPDTPLPEGATTISLEPSTNDRLSMLTPRELDVLRRIAQGMSTIEIARSLHRSTKTIEGHRVSLGVKLNARNRVELAQIAWLWGLAPAEKPNGSPPER